MSCSMVQVISISPPQSSFTDAKNKKKQNPLNPLSAATRKYLYNSINEAISDSNITSIVLFGGKNFSAGADISEFLPTKTTNPKQNLESTDEVPSLVDLCTLIESSSKPIVAAITGVALGGGCELSLACHFRVAHTFARIGLPEVKIGLIPGAGGTQRLVRRTRNVPWSLGVITSGRMVGMEEAKKMGLLEEVVGGTESVLDAARRWAEYAELWKDLTFVRACNLRVVPDGDLEGMKKAVRVCDQTLRKLPPVELGGEAHHAAVRAVKASLKGTFEEGMEVEAEAFWDLLLNGKQGRALRHAFFAERMAQKSDVRDNGHGPVVAREVVDALLGGQATVGIVGAGTMGSGIAIAFLRAGFKVILVDNNAKGLERGSTMIRTVINGDVAKKRLSSAKATTMLDSHLSTTTNMKTGEFSNCLLVVEAVFENLQVKQAIFQQLDQIISHPHALLLSNTSTLNIDSIASALQPSRRPYCAGMHFFSPAHVMKLVEIVKSSHSSSQTIALVQTITAKKLKKVGVTVGNCEGFVGNRMLFPYTGESVFVLEDGGVSVPVLDEALTSFGMAIGPMAMGDLAGNDIGYLVRKGKGFVKDPTTGQPGPNRKSGMRYTDLADDLVVKLERLGQKKLKGWYDYNPNIGRGRKPLPSKEVAAFISSYASTGVIAPLSKTNIVERVLFPLVNEGFKILEEDIARNPSDIDVIYLHGYGWPAWRGGPMYWADHEVGLTHLLTRLKQFHLAYPGSDYFVPSKLLETCVAMGVGIQDFYNRGYHKNKEMIPMAKL